MELTESPAWRVEQADRFRIIIDADRYFAAAREAFLLARSRIMLIGWDFDARIVLSEHRRPQEPGTIGELLYWLVERNPQLEIYLLRWDVGAIKTLFRGSTILTVLKWARHPRIHTKLDGHHPTGGSHHQKIISIDDCFAFCGGIDMTGARWDTREHLDDQPGRRTPAGAPYDPWHDATTAMTGAAAGALAQLCRDRWRAATGERLAPVEAAGDCWPETIEPDARNIRVAIARTVPAMPDQAEVREIAAGYAAQIARARRSVYMESQYFASRRSAEAIARRLQSSDGPEFVIINPESAEGWLEPLAMDTARARLMKALMGLDRFGRLAMYHPVTAQGKPIYAHAKLTVIDDRLVRVGSANLNNRSMGLDSECDVWADADENPGGPVGELASRTRDGLLAEHLGCSVDTFQHILRERGSLIAAIEALRGEGKTLIPYRLPELDETTEWLADSELLDPESPDEMFEPLRSRVLLRGRLRA